MSPSSDSINSDEEIAARVQRGDVAAFGMLVERYEEKMMRYGRRFLFGADDMKDLVQDVFLKAYVNIQSFDPARRFSPWIYRIAHNEFVNALKKKSGKELLFSFFDFDTLFPHLAAEETADHEINNKELRKILDQCLDKLDSKHREPLILYYYEDMDYKAIADVLQIPISTVGVRLRRGKEMLKKVAKQLKVNYA